MGQRIKKNIKKNIATVKSAFMHKISYFIQIKAKYNGNIGIIANWQRKVWKILFILIRNGNQLWKNSLRNDQIQIGQQKR